jgi:hypothetical protein
MPNKTERILGYLPRTFQALPKPTALYSLVDAFGGELLHGENSLAALMLAHWVEHADRGAELIEDLTRIAALYGLAPRPEESVEEFREHLLRYIRTFIEGTVTPQGILRITAEALALRIADRYEDMDSWWTRAEPELLSIEASGANAALSVLGLSEAVVTGHDAHPAQVVGSVKLADGVDLRPAKLLRIKLDAGPALAIDLTTAAADAAVVSLAELLTAINAAAGAPVASTSGARLVLASPTTGAAGRIQVLDGTEDAAFAVLGLAPLQYRGRAASAASVQSLVDLSSGADMSAERFLRLQIDGAQLWEIDCVGADPAHTSLDEIRTAINAAFGFPLASHDGQRLTLTSQTQGLGSRIESQTPAAQDATARLFGAVPPLAIGAAAAPARLLGAPDLSLGVDLRSGAELSLKVDGGAPLLVNCAGADPGQTLLTEIVAAINTAFGAAVASHNTRQLLLTSPTSGPTGLIAVQTPVANDAAPALLGLQLRVFTGGAATAAQFKGSVDLSAGIDLAACYRLQLALDGAPPVTINLRSEAADRRSVTLAELAAAVNGALGATVASHDGQHLILTAPAPGAASRLALLPCEREERRRFVTRATIIDEAARAVFGFIAAEAQGIPATAARLAGSADLSRGVDLRQQRYLRLSIDQHPAVEIDCAGPRPRATLPAEVVAAINSALQPLGLEQVASHDGKRLLLVSPSFGEASRILLTPPQIADARSQLLGADPQTVTGVAARGVRFTGTVPLTAGIDLPAGAAISLGVDGNPPVEISPVAAAPQHKNLNQLMLAINLALGANIASHDGRYLSLTSPVTGAASRLEFALPSGTDVTAQLFGIAAPRGYQGSDALAARIIGSPDLSAGSDLRLQRFLSLGVNGQPPQAIDCAAGAADAGAVSLAEIVAAINTQTGSNVAAQVAGRLQLTSTTAGAASRLVLAPYVGSDAAERLFGPGLDSAQGSAPAPASLAGQVDLRQPVDLSQRQSLRLAVDGARPVDIPVAGAAACTTFGDEIVAAINAVVPGLALLDDQGQLQLRSKTAGEDSRIALLPLRFLELIEYPPQPRLTALALRHGEGFALRNDGAAEVEALVEFFAPQGVAGPGLVNLVGGWQVRLLTVLAPGEGARLWRDPYLGLQAARLRADGGIEPLPAEAIVTDSSEGGGTAAEVLRVVRGRSRWLFLSCQVSRFDSAEFEADHFAGGPCRSLGIFDVSRFVDPANPKVTAVFGPGQHPEPAVEVQLGWNEHLPGAFTVNLPADLPPRFGGRFNQARFALPGEKPELYAMAVTEPVGDPDYLPALLNARSALVKAQLVASVPLGWQAVAMPFRKPCSLTLGSEAQPARLHLAEEGFAGFLEIEAKLPGAAGNSIAVTARKVGPTLFDVTVAFQGGRFENARQLVLGEPLPALTEQLLQPGPVGLLQAKAAGTRATVTRDSTIPQP